MEIHKGLDIPVLSSSVPYATRPIARDEQFVAYARRENRDLRQFGVAGAVMTFFYALGIGFLVVNAGWVYVWPITVGGSMKIGPFLLLMVFIAGAISAWCLLFGKREVQLHVDHTNGNAQVRKTKEAESSVYPGIITVCVSKLIQNRSASTTKSLLGKRHQAHLVVVHVGQAGMILGAFKDAKSATRYAHRIQEETTLPIAEIDDERFEYVIGFWAIGRDDEWAFKQLA